ncbi:hypothetical protein L7F22_054111 [Adiantum nelumboides]|nr:hypothetical protein [Adiantum nelumboides]
MASSHDSSLYNIKKLNGTNFQLWKKQIWHVLVQKKQLKPIKLKGIKPEDMDEDQWNKMNELALSTIMLTLVKSVYFNIADEVSAYDAWTKLSVLYEKQTAASQVSWLKKLVDLKMKEGTPMSNHLNEFNTIYSQLSAQGVRFDEPVRAMFLLITLPESWETFRIALSNSAPPNGLSIAGVEGILLTEETNRKIADKGKGIALVVRVETHIHVQLPPMLEMLDLPGTSYQEEEGQGPAPGALDVKAELIQSIEDMPKIPTNNFMLYETKVLKSAALAYLQPNEQVKDVGHDFLPLPLMRHEANP